MKVQSAQQVELPRCELDFAEPEIDDLLKFSLRQQIEALTQRQLSQAERKIKLQQSFTKTIEAVLSTSQLAHATLEQTFTAMYDNAMLSMAQAELSQDVLTRQYVGPTGLVISPLNCTTTIKDIYRIQGFARGLHRAILGQLEHKSSLTLLYPACGPFAPLLLPLVQYYKTKELVTSKQLRIILVDIQPGAIASLQQLVSDLDVSDYIDQIVESDVLEYTPPTDIDILLLEALQHGFTKEGQLSMARHLVPFLSLDGWLIPQSISVKGVLVDAEMEFNQQWKDVPFTHSSHLSAGSQRIELGEILHISKSTLLAMQPIMLANNIQVVEANALTLPEGVEDMPERILAIYAEIQTFSNERVNQYDSGITHPLPDMTFYVDAKPRVPKKTHFVANGGDTVKFYYQLTGLPRFIPTKA